MATHEFICDLCGVTVTDTTAMNPHPCPQCGDEMRWDLSGIGIRAGDYRHVSHSLAIHPDQIPEHKKLFPHVEVQSDGCPVFTSPRQQEQYANACGFDKKSQKNRRKGVRI